MTKKSNTIVFFGNERLATGVKTDAPTLRRLIAAGYTVVAVVANYERGISRKSRRLEIADIAAEHNIPLLLPTKLSDITEELQSFKAVAAVLVAYGRIVPEPIIDIFPSGIINIHPSLLPLHRGPTPLESVILAGDKVTGVSLMQLAKAMDAGPVYAQEKISLTGNENKQILADQLLTLGGDMLIKHMPAILEGNLAPRTQKDTEATYDALISKEDGIIKWSKPAGQIEREIRAFAGWPGSKSTFNGLDITLLSAHVQGIQGDIGMTTIIDKKPAVFCGQGALVIDSLKPAAKQAMTGEAFLAGYKQIFLTA